jgi:hypothetical protein
MRVRETNRRVAPVSKDGRPMVRDAAHEAADSGSARDAAPHHEAERDRVCIKLTGIGLVLPATML